MNYDVIYKKRTGDKVNGCLLSLSFNQVSGSSLMVVLYSIEKISSISLKIIKLSSSNQESR